VNGWGFLPCGSIVSWDCRSGTPLTRAVLKNGSFGSVGPFKFFPLGDERLCTCCSRMFERLRHRSEPFYSVMCTPWDCQGNSDAFFWGTLHRSHVHARRKTSCIVAAASRGNIQGAIAVRQSLRDKRLMVITDRYAGTLILPVPVQPAFTPKV
jgi:hypothetical protein